MSADPSGTQEGTPRSISLENYSEDEKQPEFIVDEAEAVTRNSRGTSSWTIFASALANFSDGYQMNLVCLIHHHAVL